VEETVVLAARTSERGFWSEGEGGSSGREKYLGSFRNERGALSGVGRKKKKENREEHG